MKAATIEVRKKNGKFLKYITVSSKILARLTIQKLKAAGLQAKVIP